MEDVHSEFCPSLWTFFFISGKNQKYFLCSKETVFGRFKKARVKIFSYIKKKYYI